MTPFSIAAQLLLPSDPSLPPSPIPFAGQSNFSNLADVVLSLTGSGTKTVPLGSIPTAGVIGLLIKVDPIATGPAPIYLTINGGNQPLEISPGGGLLYFNPNPTAGITAMSVAFTVNCTVRIWAVG